MHCNPWVSFIGFLSKWSTIKRSWEFANIKILRQLFIISSVKSLFFLLSIDSCKLIPINFFSSNYRLLCDTRFKRNKLSIIFLHTHLIFSEKNTIDFSTYISFYSPFKCENLLNYPINIYKNCIIHTKEGKRFYTIKTVSEKKESL